MIKSVWPEWEIVDLIGEGSYGKVYKAVRNDNGITAYSAIKIISIPKSGSELKTLRSEGMDENASRTYLHGVVNSLVGEIKVMISLGTVSNVVSVHDYKVMEKTNEIGWEIHIRMELLTGLEDHLSSNRLSEKQITKLGIDICSALEFCERCNPPVIHRDVKPDNIFITQFGDYKLGDFGTARELEKTRGNYTEAGTPNYMAPEIKNRKPYGVTADIYSLGIVLYRLLNNNRLPFCDPDKQVLQYSERAGALDRRFNGEPLPPPVNAGWKMANIILKACAFDPNRRFRSASEFKAALLSIASPVYPQGSDVNLQDIANKTVSMFGADTSGGRGSAPVDLNATTADLPAPRAQNYNARAPVPPTGSFGKEKKKGTWIAILIAIVAVVFVAVIALTMLGLSLLFSHTKDADVSSESSVTTSATTEPVSTESTTTIISTTTVAATIAPPEITIYPDSMIGNIPGNIANGGYAASQDDRIYYHNSSDGGRLYSVKTDGTDKRKLNDDESYSINVVDDRIYYCNDSDGARLYTIKTDGTGRQRLNDDGSGCINVVGDRAYYIASTDNHKIYTIRTDGTGRQKLNDDESYSINVIGDRIYYSNSSDGGKIYTIKTDGTGRQKLCDDESRDIVVSGGRIYYCNDSDGNHIYAINPDGTGRQRLNDDKSWFINVVGDRIFYSNNSDGGRLYTIKTDGTGRQKLNDHDSSDINVAGDRIYYCNWSDDGNLYIANLDGSGNQPADYTAENPEPYDQKIIVSSVGTSATLQLYEWSDGDWTETFYTSNATVGESGVGADYGEGKSITPKGQFNLGFCYGVNRPDTKLDFIQVYPDTVFVDDVNSEFYNMIVDKNFLPANVHYEQTYKYFAVDHYHSTCIFIESNGDGLTKGTAVPGRGSVISICGANGALSPTFGDVDISSSDMAALLRLLDSSKNPQIIIN